MSKIITIGSATRDVFLISDKFNANVVNQKSGNITDVVDKSFCFSVGDKVEVEDIFFSTGGGGTNSAATFARLGIETACIGMIGDDPGGRASLEDLEQLGVDTQHMIKTDKYHTGYSVIISASGVGRTILVHRGASKKLTESNIPWEAVGESRWVYVTSLGGDLTLLEKIAQTTEKSGVNLALNPGSTEIKKGIDELEPILKRTKVLLLNEEEITVLLGEELDDLTKKISELSKKFPDMKIVVTRGPNGVMAASGSKIYQAEALGGEVAERSGAGDAFGSGFIAGLIMKDAIEYAMQLGSANANSVIKELGAKNGLLKKDKLDSIEKVIVKEL